MTKKPSHFMRTISFIVLFVILSVQILPMTVSALGAEVVTEVGPNLITNILTTANTTYTRIKDSVLDPLAYAIAGIMLQQVTMSVVNWINTGFQGSPAFLSNPEAFFMDVGDQVTGAFISETGVLSGLCSPFSIDIRLALVLGQSNNLQKRYTCTLSSVINNVGNSTINGRSINGFMNGDFSQGGWPAFISMTTNPQNNVTGAYLTAQSDLLQKIGVTKDRYRQDLIQGSGFLSWPKCTDVPVEQMESWRSFDESTGGPDYSAIDNTGNQSVSLGYGTYTGSPATLEKRVDKTTKQVTYQSCEIQTPGSVIGGAINKSLGIPQDRLNLAASFNQIVSALFAQLVTQVLSGGLKSASNPGSGNLGGVATQLSQQSQNNQLADARQKMRDAITGYYTTTSEYSQLRQQAMDSINAVRSQYLAAKACFDAKVGSTTQNYGWTMNQITYARSQMAFIDSSIATKVTPLENIYRAKLVESNNRISSMQSILRDIDNATTTEAMRLVSAKFSTAVQDGSITQNVPGSVSGFTNQMDIMNAQNDLVTLQGQLAPLTAEANQFQQSCSIFPNYSSQYGL